MRRAGSDEYLGVQQKIPSVKHDVLFSKARYFLNQRHIKRPCFNLNPFLEKKDENIDLENFLPEESKNIQPFESLVLCESFHNDNSLDTKEISIGKMFKFNLEFTSIITVQLLIYSLIFILKYRHVKWYYFYLPAYFIQYCCHMR
jgi:hypothetical protein